MKSPWVSVQDRMPKDGEPVDVWFDVYASPLSMGMADQWCEPETWRENGKWFHHFKQENNAKLELQSRYITHWKPMGPVDIEGPDSVVWQASALCTA